MDFYDIPIYLRIVFLVAFLGIIAAFDLYRRRDRATRWKEYLFLLFAGTIGAVFGVLNDLITSNLSPEYFEFGKGISAGPNFLNDVLLLGASAGFTAGIVSACVFLYVNNPKPDTPSLSYGQLQKMIAKPVGCATMGGILGYGLLNVLYFFPIAGDLRPRSFFSVLGIHWGLYLGLFIGIVWGVISIRRQRRASKCSAE